MSYDNFCRTARRSTRDVARSNMAPVHAIRASPCSLYGYCSDTMFLLDLRIFDVFARLSRFSVFLVFLLPVFLLKRVCTYIYYIYFCNSNIRYSLTVACEEKARSTSDILRRTMIHRESVSWLSALSCVI